MVQFLFLFSIQSLTSSFYQICMCRGDHCRWREWLQFGEFKDREKGNVVGAGREREREREATFIGVWISFQGYVETLQEGCECGCMI